MVSQQRHKVFRRHVESLEAIVKLLKSYSLKCTEWNSRLQEVFVTDETLAQNLSHLKDERHSKKKKTAFGLLANDNVKMNHLIQAGIPELQQLISSAGDFGDRLAQCVEIEAQYSPYKDSESYRIELIKREEALTLSPEFDYFDCKLHLSTEARGKLSQIKPSTVAEASRIPGVDPSDVLAIITKLSRGKDQHGEWRKKLIASKKQSLKENQLHEKPTSLNTNLNVECDINKLD